MGGNALSVASVRLAAQDYFEIERNTLATLRRAFPEKRIASVLAFASKANFGDLDILYEAGENEVTELAAVLQSTEVVVNGDVTSIGIRVAQGLFQVDLISIPAASFSFAERYFGFNDLGNLLGRIAYKFGAKFGHLGLLLPLRDAENSHHMIAELSITKDFAVALQLLGYDAQRYEYLRNHGGFNDLEDIFRFVLTSPYANRDIYLLENRNYKSRIRDAKRPTYTAFLRWLAEQAEGSLPNYPWAESGSAERLAQNHAFLQRAFDACPDFAEEYQRTLAEYERKKQVRKRFNGERASQVTGITGKRLGQLMASVRNAFADEAAFDSFILAASSEEIDASFQQHAQHIN